VPPGIRFFVYWDLFVHCSALEGVFDSEGECALCYLKRLERDALTCQIPDMTSDLENFIRIAVEEFRILLPEEKATGLEIEEVEKHPQTGHYSITIGYWARDNKPAPEIPSRDGVIHGYLTSTNDLFNPWRRKYKRVEVDPVGQKAIAIRMYEPPIGVS